MNDIRLWRLLEPNCSATSSEIDEIKSLLAKLAVMNVRVRMPYFSRLKSLNASSDSELQTLQMKFLSGASGWRAWEWMLEKTDSDFEEVRRAAVSALMESAERSPWLKMHLVFHSNPQVRLDAVNWHSNNNRQVPSTLLHLLCDDATKHSVSAAIETTGTDESVSLRLAVELHRSGKIPTELIRKILARMTPNQMMDGIQELPNFSESEHSKITSFRGLIPEELFTPTAAEYDGLQWLVELFWDFDDESLFPANDYVAIGGAKDETQREYAAQFYQNVAECARLFPHYMFRESLVSASLVTAAKTGKWNRKMAGYCAANSADFLLRDAIEKDALLAAGQMLYRLRGRVVEASPEKFEELILSDFCRNENGQIDLWSLGAVLYYRRTGALSILMDHYSENQIVTAFLSDPERSAAFFSYNGSITKRRELIEAIRSQRKKIGNLLDALLLHVVTPDGLSFLEDLTEKQVLALLERLVEMSAKGELELTARKTSVTGEILARKLSSKTALEFLASWVQADQPEKFELGLDLLAYIGRKRDFREPLIEFLKQMEAKQLLKLLNCVVRCSGFPYGAEVEIAIGLADYDNDDVNSWAVARIPEKESPAANDSNSDSDPSTDQLLLDSDGFPFAEIKSDVANRLSTCLDSELRHAIASCLKIPTRGLCDALKPRPPVLKPVGHVAAAILGSADPLTEIDEQFQVFGSEDPKFLKELDLLMASAWQKVDNLHVMAAAWLHRWEKRAFEFAELALKDSGSAIGLLNQSAKMESVVLSQQIWLALKRSLMIWRFRNKDRYVEFLDLRFLQTVASELDGRYSEIAAEILINVHASMKAGAELNQIRAEIYDRLPEFSPEVRRILQPWIDSKGFSGQTTMSRKKPGDLDEDTLDIVNRCVDLKQLMQWCEDHTRSLVTNAALRCVALGGVFLDGMIQLLRQSPPPLHSDLLADTVSLWPAEMRDQAAELMNESTLGGMTRFLIGMNLLDCGGADDANGVDDANFIQLLQNSIAIVCEDVQQSWLQRDDLERLREHSRSDHWLAIQLATSPHPRAYRWSINLLLQGSVETNEFNAIPSLQQDSMDALRRFLECGTHRMSALRLFAAAALQKNGDHTGYPILLQAESETDNGPGRYLKQFPDGLVEETMEACLLAGHLVFNETKLLSMLNLGRNSPEPHNAAAIELNSAAVSNNVRQMLARRLRQSLSRSQKLKNVAEAFAWGIPIARQLTGRLFSIEMIGGDDYGYTRLNESKVYINPLSILQRKPNGREVVQGLILHELGHHMYHRGKQQQKVWDRAEREGLFKLLNLVSDEHLERNLRAMDRSFGDRLKRLGAYVFQHSSKEVDCKNLLHALHCRAFEVLSKNRLGVARRPNCVKLSTRHTLQEMERHGMSFTRFFRALRLGLGNRFNDPKVEAALKLFGKNFRHSSMQELYEIVLKLRGIFRNEIEILNCFGQGQIVEGEGSQITIDGEGISNQDVQEEIQRISNPAEKSSKGSGGGRWINVSEDESFEPITLVQKVVASRSEHAKYADQVVRYANQLRGYLSELGLVMVPQRRRIRGSKLDRGSLQSAVLRRDPRILKLREPRFETDLYLGVCVDCSGSMEFDNNIEKAKLFGALLTEAVRGMASIDLQVFGFTDSVIYDAGGAELSGLANLKAGGGNNDAAALLHAAHSALRSRRKAKLLVMISDGLPTECSAEALKSLVRTLTRKWKMCCAQVAVQPLEEVCFPNYVLLDTNDPASAVREFGKTVARLVRKSMGG